MNSHTLFKYQVFCLQQLKPLHVYIFGHWNDDAVLRNDITV